MKPQLRMLALAITAATAASAMAGYGPTSVLCLTNFGEYFVSSGDQNNGLDQSGTSTNLIETGSFRQSCSSAPALAILAPGLR